MSGLFLSLISLSGELDEICPCPSEMPRLGLKHYSSPLVGGAGIKYRTRPESSLPLSTDQGALGVRSQLQAGRMEAMWQELAPLTFGSLLHVIYLCLPSLLRPNHT